jgi:hypothetical protein
MVGEVSDGSATLCDHCAPGDGASRDAPFPIGLSRTAGKEMRTGLDREAISAEYYLDRRSCDRRTITPIQSAITDTR